ncbi:SsrA-binding protein SmpB [Candidatus Saccharibacteria bacterium]|nr:SsrA-binding protein SmpB [Candidatus Saccharibacteria bacterium]
MSKKRKATHSSGVILNRRARYDYELADELEVGIVLSGQETRAARDGHVQLRGAFVTIRDNQLWLNNASFSIALHERGQAGARSIDTSPRKLLAHRREINALMAHKTSGKTIVPVRLKNASKYMKLIIATGKGKKNYDKRETLKRRDQERDAHKELARYK